MRILLWHGYLLGGTGSNVYTRQLAREWSLAGHDVVVLSQETEPERYDLGGAATVRPDVGGFLPVFVLDRYEGFHDVRRVPDCTRVELDRWVEANAAAVRDQLPAELVFANHVLLGGPVGAASGARFAVKAHGSELEYAMRGNVWLSLWGTEALTGAAATFVGSGHIRQVLEEVCGQVERVHEVPPGVDVEEWVPEEPELALAALLDEARRDTPNPGNANERLPDEGNGLRLARFLVSEAPTVVYFGKLIPQKGVHVLLEALAGVEARAVVVGFGPERAALEAQASELGRVLCSRARSSTVTCATCSRSPTRASSRRSSPRRSAWSPPRPLRPGARPSWPAIPASLRSRPASRRRIRTGCDSSRRSRTAMQARFASACGSCSRFRPPIAPRSARPPVWPRRSAGAGPASRGVCSTSRRDALARWAID